MDDIIDLLTEKIKKNLLKDPKLELEPSEPLISSGLLDSFNLVDLVPRKCVGDQQIVRIRIDRKEHSDKNDRHEDPLKNSHR